MFARSMYKKNIFEGMDPTLAKVAQVVGAVVFVPIYVVSALSFAALCSVIAVKMVGTFFSQSYQEVPSDYGTHNPEPVKCVGEDCLEKAIKIDNAG